MSDAPAVSSRYVYSAMAICLAMMTSMLWLPSQLGALAQGYSLAPAQLSPLASAELAGFVLGTLFTSTLAMKDFRRWLMIGCAVVIGANLALVFFAPQVPFLVMRPIAGLGSGIGFGYALKLCALSEKPSQSFGILTGLMSVTMIVGFQGIAQLMPGQPAGDPAFAVEGARKAAGTVFGLYAAFAAIAVAIFLSNQPPAAAAMTERGPKAQGALSPMALLGLAAIVIAFIGQGGIWAFLQTLGASHGFAVGEVANAMSAFAILGIAGSFSVAALPKSMPAYMTIGIAYPLLCAGLYALYAPQSILWYIAGCAIGGFYWNFALPQMLGLLAHIDPTGRASVLGGTMSSVGSATGPLVAGLLIQGSNYQPVGWMTASMCLLSLICVWFVEVRSRAQNSAAATI